MKKNVIIVAIFLFLHVAHAQDSAAHSNNGEASSMGIGGTVFDTWGFLYRQYFPSNIGIAASLGGWLTDYSGKIGLAIGSSYTLAHHYFASTALPSSSIRIYVIAYLGGIFRREHEYIFDKSSNKDIKEDYFALDLGLGAGPGAEFFFNRHFAVHLELPWMTFITFKRSNTLFKSSYPHIGGGLSYYF